jgi:hypothetical protein
MVVSTMVTAEVAAAAATAEWWWWQGWVAMVGVFVVVTVMEI